MTVAEDMLPKRRRSTSRDTASAGGRKLKRALDRIENRAAAGWTAHKSMSRNGVWPSISSMLSRNGRLDGGGDLTRQDHVEAASRTLPGDEIAAVGNDDGAKISSSAQSLLLGGHQGSSAAVAPQQEGEDFLEVRRF